MEPMEIAAARSATGIRAGPVFDLVLAFERGEGGGWDSAEGRMLAAWLAVKWGNWMDVGLTVPRVALSSGCG